MSKSIIICIPWNTFVVSKHKATLKKVYFYIVQYPVRWTTQNALHFSSPGRSVNSDINSASLGSIPDSHASITREYYSLTFPLLSIVRCSFIQLSELGHRGENENAQTSKR